METGLKPGLFKKATELAEAIRTVINNEAGTPESEKKEKKENKNG